MSENNIISSQEQGLLLNVSDAIPTPIFYKDTELKYMGCNRAFEKFFQKKREEIIGQTVFDIYKDFPEKAKKIQDRDLAFLASAETHYTYENDPLDYEGKKHHLIVTKAKFYHPDGTLAGIVAIMFDDTERKNSEEAFRREQILLQTLIDAIPSPIFYKDTRLGFLGCNTTFEKVDACMEKKHFLGKTSLDIFPRERAEPVYNRDARFLSSSEDQISYEQAQPNEKGALRDYVVTKSKFYHPDGSLGGFVGITFDITERKKMEERLIKTNHELTNKNDQITSSIEYASRIQKGILLDEEEIIEHFKEAFIFFRPKDIISGDFYWFAKKEDLLFIVAADCTGHGVPGALMTVLGNDFLNQIVYEQNITRPDLVLTELDAKFKKTFRKRNPEKEITDGMEVSLCVIESSTRRLHFSGAKRPLWIQRQKEMKIILGSRFSIGGRNPKREKRFELHKHQLQENDVLYLFTDGFSDQLSSHQKKFMTKNLKNFLLEHAELPLKIQEYKLKETLEKWQNGHHQTDDILILGLKPF